MTQHDVTFHLSSISVPCHYHDVPQKQQHDTGEEKYVVRDNRGVGPPTEDVKKDKIP